MKLITVLLFISSYGLASLNNAPTSFKLNKKSVIFTDFKSVESNISYNVTSKEAMATSLIRFETTEEGYPVFDLKENILSAKLNGKNIKILTIKSPGNITSYKMIDHSLPAGNHELTITNKINTNVKFNSTGLSSAFWMSDLTDRKYVEQYLPTNIEFDSYELLLEVKVVGKNVDKHEVFTNGFTSQVSDNHFKIRFPEYFTTSSFYFHLTKKDRFKREVFRFNSTSGKSIPVIIYGGDFFSNLQTAKAKTISVLKELEAKLGPWTHPSLTIYIAGQGGMEHSGATITSMRALGHEITHSYFARGVMPVNGNSGWLDEAIASWRDKGYKEATLPNFSSTRMSGHSEYKRTTDRKAYTEGANFMAYLNYKLKNQGGLISFLNKFHAHYVHKSVSTKLFKKELELYSGIDFTADFNKYIFGKKNAHKVFELKAKENPYHPKLTKKQLLDLL